MTLQELRNSDKFTNYTVTLKSGIVINYPSILDGGGTELIDDYLKIFDILNKKYKNAFEWCSGFGILGFEILGSGIAENIYFSENVQRKLNINFEIIMDSFKDNNLVIKELINKIGYENNVSK